MTTLYPMPDANTVRTMLGGRFEGVSIRSGKRFAVAAHSGCWVRLYLADNGAPVAACVADSAFAAHAGSALSLLPVADARAALVSKKLSEGMVANLREILNVCARLLMVDGCPHLRLDDLYCSDALPEPAATLLKRFKWRIDFEFNFPKYGPGTLAVVST